MSTVEQRSPTSAPTTGPLLVDGQRLGQAEFHRRYEAMPPRTRAELVAGIVRMPGPMTADHGELTPDVSLWIGLYRRRTPGVRQADERHGHPGRVRRAPARRPVAHRAGTGRCLLHQ